MKMSLPVLLALSLVATARAGLVEKTVIYHQGGATLEGFHVYDDAVTGKRPAILVVHQWTGLTDYEKRRSRALAELGFNVFAADIYGQGIRPQPPEAGKEAGKYKGDRALYRARLTAALDWLKADERSDGTKLAVAPVWWSWRGPGRRLRAWCHSTAVGMGRRDFWRSRAKSRRRFWYCRERTIRMPRRSR